MRGTFDLGGDLPLGRTVVLQASAGTGKTYAVATLAARALAEGVVTLDELMVITFSSASTRELRSRVRSRVADLAHVLAAACEGEKPTDPAWSAVLDKVPAEIASQRIGTALVGFDAAMICTTHQFCDRMLAELGVLADHDPEAQAVDNVDNLIEDAVRDEFLFRYAQFQEGPFDLKTALTIGRRAVENPETRLVPAPAVTRKGEERRSFAKAVRDRVEQLKRQFGLYTFDDMQTRLLDALRHPSTGEAAKQRLRDRFPLVLVDEFQDTDPVQWDILRESFVGHVSVVLIGDPKQSIYGFRGAGVHAYLDAVRDHDAQDLATNRRTTPELVQAIQTIFDGARLGAPEITVGPVESLPTAQRLVVDGPWQHAMRLRISPNPSQRANAYSRLVDEDLAQDINSLLGAGANLVLDGASRPMRADDVAVIVTTNARGHRIHKELSSARIPAVFTGVNSVFTSPAANDWRKLLVAIDEPRQAAVRAAALTDLVGWDLKDIAMASDDEMAALTGEVRRWGRLVERDGIAALMQALLANGTAARVNRLPEGDRLLTDLRHVAELLHAHQTASKLPPLGLVAWLDFQARQRAARGDDRSRRLETDEAAIRILTVHQAKGLEFAVVYLPELATRYVRTLNDDPITLHQEVDGVKVRLLDVGGRGEPGRDERERLCRAEDDGESLRALYVALTRAKCHVTAWWGRTDKTAEAPLQRILFREARDDVKQRVEPRNDVEPRRFAGADVVLEVMGNPKGRSEVSQTSIRPHAIQRQDLTRSIDVGWRRTSYSAITAPAHDSFQFDNPLLIDEPSEGPNEEVGELPVAVTVVPDPALDALSPMAGLPGGVGFGSLVHVVFETFDPHSPTPEADLTNIVARETTRLPIPGVAKSELVAGLLPVLDTPLGPLADGLTLADIPARDRLAELDFEMPLGSEAAGATVQAIADSLDAWLPEHDPLRDYGEHLRQSPVDQRALRGYLTGSIDVALRIGGRYLIIDYKTNRLGTPGSPLTLRQYTPSAMAAAMMEAHYPLQSLLYGVALHRFLRWRQLDYDPEHHLGGILYLFVRGMAGPDTPVIDGVPCGVFSWRPPTGLILELSDVLAGVR
ncbi:MAG TPA: UvrD-helicase domain-containing protein [Propionibacteriaceae bacterium]